MFDQPRGGLTQHHATGRRRRLHPLCHADLLTNGRVSERARTDFTGDHLTGIESHPQLADTRRHALGRPRQVAWPPPGRPRRETGTKRMVLQRHWCTEQRHDSVTSELVHSAAITLHHRCGAIGQSAMISRSRSGPTAAAMSIEWTTSANRTVTCLYSAWVSCLEMGVPQPSQNRAPSRGSCHTCGTWSLRSSDPPPLPAPEVPVHQHRAACDPAGR